jgi:hypothetical protein
MRGRYLCDFVVMIAIVGVSLPPNDHDLRNDCTTQPLSADADRAVLALIRIVRRSGTKKASSRRCRLRVKRLCLPSFEQRTRVGSESTGATQ